MGILGVFEDCVGSCLEQLPSPLSSHCSLPGAPAGALLARGMLGMALALSEQGVVSLSARETAQGLTLEARWLASRWTGSRPCVSQAFSLPKQTTLPARGQGWVVRSDPRVWCLVFLMRPLAGPPVPPSPVGPPCGSVGSVSGRVISGSGCRRGVGKGAGWGAWPLSSPRECI